MLPPDLRLRFQDLNSCSRNSETTNSSVVPKNKCNLQTFLTNSWRNRTKTSLALGQPFVIGGGFSCPEDAYLVFPGEILPLPHLKCNHEEADTRILLHENNASSYHERVVVQTPDTDVVVLSVFAFDSLRCKQLWIRTGTKDSVRFIPVHNIVDKIGPTICAALPGFHSLTGCDTTSSLMCVGNKKAWKVLCKSKTYQQTMSLLGKEIPLPVETAKVTEAFVCALYTTSKKAGSTADKAR